MQGYNKIPILIGEIPATCSAITYTLPSYPHQKPIHPFFHSLAHNKKHSFPLFIPPTNKATYRKSDYASFASSAAAAAAAAAAFLALALALALAFFDFTGLHRSPPFPSPTTASGSPESHRPRPSSRRDTRPNRWFLR